MKDMLIFSVDGRYNLRIENTAGKSIFADCTEYLAYLGSDILATLEPYFGDRIRFERDYSKRVVTVAEALTYALNDTFHVGGLWVTRHNGQFCKIVIMEF